MTENVLPFPPPDGYFTLADLPQRPPIGSNAISTGWWELDEIFKLYLGQFIVLTGIAGHGKSTFILNIISNLARKNGTRSFLYVPENEQHLREKMRKIWRNDESFRYFAENQCFVQSSAVEAEDGCRDLRWVLNRATRAVRNDDVDLVLIDPWNELDRAKPRDMLMSDYIGESLMMVKDFCRTCNAIVIIVAHPTKAVNENGGRVAGLADIEGSMNWFNKCDNGLIVVRDAEKNTARVISAKVREIGAGKLGVCHFWVDPLTGLYTPQVGGVL
jgi:twinkle protein